LPTREWLAFFEELATLGIMNLTLLGGEPFMRQDLGTLIESIVANGMRFGIASNGALIDAGIAAFLAQTGRCDHVQISLDGSRAEVHDSARGTGAFEGAVRGVRLLRSRGIEVTGRMTIHRGNYRDLQDTARFLLDELGVSCFSTNSVEYLGACRFNAESLMLKAAERQEAMSALFSLVEEYPGRVQATAGPLAEAQIWKTMEEARVEQAPPPAGGGCLSGCGGVFSRIAIRSDGVIVPCGMLAHMELGRINRDSLGQLWRENPTLSRLRQRRDIPLAGITFCADCGYKDYCTGNCPGVAYALTGEVDHPSPGSCLRQFLEHGGSLT